MTKDTKDTIEGYKPLTTKQYESMSKKDIVIAVKLQNPDVSLKNISRIEGISYIHTRREWSKYKKLVSMLKGEAIPPLDSPFPFNLHHVSFEGTGPTSWYEKCPVEPSTNRNSQKSYATSYYSFVIHKRGKHQIYIHHPEWRNKIREWLLEWLHEEETHLLLEYVTDRGGKHYAVDAPGIPKGFSLNVLGIGKWGVDKTPYPDGSMEYEVDPGFVPRLNRIERFIERQVQITGNMVNAQEIYAKGMREHMVLIKELQDVSRNQQQISKDFNKAINFMMESFNKLMEKLGD